MRKKMKTRISEHPFFRGFDWNIQVNGAITVKTLYLELRQENGEVSKVAMPGISPETGSVFYYKNNVLHREGKPAVEFADGWKEWWVNGKFIKATEGKKLPKATKKISNPPPRELSISGREAATIEIEKERLKSRLDEAFGSWRFPIRSEKSLNKIDPTLSRHGVSSSLYG